MKENKSTGACKIPQISDRDIYQAMEELCGYVDITSEDFGEIYRHAFQHAFQKMSVQESSELAFQEKVSDKATHLAGHNIKEQALF
ncbi:MAG: hypothetical protein GY850_32770, partial [bacterium]|nr:hypothetical protein [bacterium]